MIGDEGLEEIGKWEFRECTSLQHEISIPAAVKVIKEGAFARCSHLTIVKLCEGLEKVEEEEFYKCT